jgi:tRNA-2-methylthio-N6-dimethylallyladenosine synthase
MTRTYTVETYGCQMNVHDSERIAGLLDEAGFIPVNEGEQADIVVFNTCAVRENADNKLYGNLSFLAPIKKANPNMQIAVGGCLAQKDQATILKKAPYVDVVFGTHNVGSLPVLLERARVEEESQIEILEALEHFPSTLPAVCQLFLRGFQFQWVATTPVLFALFPLCVESKKIAMKPIFCPKLKPLLTKGLLKLPC